MPHNPNVAADMVAVEQDLLGLMLANREKFSDFADLLRPEDFGEELHQCIYRTMQERHDLGEVPTGSSIVARLGNRDLGEGVDLKGYLARLTVHAKPGTAGLRASVRAVRDASAMRELRDIHGELKDELSRGVIIDPQPLANKLVKRLDAIIQANASDTAKPLTLGRASDMALQNMMLARDGKQTRAIKTGIASIDKMTGGAKPGDLIILAGRPAMGKTAVGITISLNAAKQTTADGRPLTAVMNASLEMTAVDLAERAISAEAAQMGVEIPYQWIGNGCDDQGQILSDAQVEALFKASARIDTLPYLIEQQPGLTLAQLCARTRRYVAQCREKGIENAILVVDYLGLVSAGDRYRGHKVHELGEITRGLKALAKELGIPILLLCQLSRAVEHREDKHPILADLRDSGEIEQDADVVLFVYREEYYLQNVLPETLPPDEREEHYARLSACLNVLEIGVMKQRKGPTGWVKNYCNIACNTVSELRN